MQSNILTQQNQSSWRKSLIFLGVAAIMGPALGVFVVKFNNPVYLLLGLAGLAAFIGTFVSVDFGLLFLVFITYTRISDVAVHFHNAPSIAQPLVVLLVLAILIRWAVFKEKPMGWELPMILLGLYGLIGLASIAYAKDTGLVISKLSDYIKDILITLTVIAIIVRRPAVFRPVIWSLLVAGIFMGTLSVYQYITGTFSNNYGGFAVAEFLNITGGINDYRLSGTVGDPNFYAQIMLVLMPIALERMLHEKKFFPRILAGWAAVVSFLTVIFTFSRGGFIGMMVALLIFAFLKPPRPIDLVLVIGLGIGSLFFVPSSYFDRVLSLESLIPGQSDQGINVRSDNAFQGRASQVLTAWSMIKRYPLLGVGWNNFAIRYQEFSKEIGLAPSASARSIHNLYLEVAAETGILGFSSFLSIILLTFNSILNSWKAFRETSSVEYINLTSGLASGFGGYLMAAIFIHSAYPRYFYLLIGIIFALPLIAKQMQLKLIRRGARV